MSYCFYYIRKDESKEIDFETETLDKISTPNTKEIIDSESWISRPSINIDNSETNSVIKEEMLPKPVKVEINIDPSKTLSLKMRTSAKKDEGEEKLGKPKKMMKEKKIKKDMVKVNDLIINKDLINSNRF